MESFVPYSFFCGEEKNILTNKGITILIESPANIRGQVHKPYDSTYA
jgi:hypothetical protein